MTDTALAGRLDSIITNAKRARIIKLPTAISARVVNQVPIYYPDSNAPPFLVPLFSVPVCAGKPTPALDPWSTAVDLNAFCFRDRTQSFMVRAAGDSMSGVGIQHGDLLIVDRGLEPRTGRVVIAVIDGFMTVKTIIHQADGNRTILQPENPDYHAIDITDEKGVRIWGVVTKAIHDLPT